MIAFKEACKHFSTVSGIGTALVNAEGLVVYNTLMSGGKHDLPAEKRKLCSQNPPYSNVMYMSFGGKYMFYCQKSFTYLASPIFNKGEMKYGFFAGPFILSDAEDYKENDDIVTISSKKALALSETISYIAGHLSRKEDGDCEHKCVPRVIYDYVERLQDKPSFNPLEIEEELLNYMAVGDEPAARALLNELLGYIFFYSGYKFDIIRSRVLELIILLSRVAMKGGADPELIFGINYDYCKEIGKYDNAVDLAYWLSNVMNRFTDHVFLFAEAKHADIIFKAINYIKANYMHKLVLEDVAGSVFLSPAYFSRVFKQETGYNFSGYLNKTRINESKKLLKNAGINISDIAGMVGYEDQSYFSKVFKKIAGMSPLKFRQSRGKLTGQ